MMQQRSIFRYGFLLEQLVKRNFNTKYRQSVLGVLWSFLNPLWGWTPSCSMGR